MMTDVQARTILATWIHEAPAEDIKLIPAENFPEPYDKIAREIRNGATDEDLIRGFKGKIVANILADHHPEIYKAVMSIVLKDEMMRTLPEHPTPDELADHAKKYARYWQRGMVPVDIASAYWDELGDRKKREAVGTGIAVVDNLTDGIRPGALTIVGARPSVGKSAFALNVAVNVARKGKRVIFLPLEMTAAETVDRIVLRFGTGLEYADLRSGDLDEGKKNAVNTVIDFLYDLRNEFRIFEGVRKLDQIRALIQNEHPDLIVIDQLSQIQTNDERATIRERYVEVTRGLKAIALEERVAIWLPVQMNRESSKTGTVTIDYLKESGSIEEDADIVLLLSNAKDDKGETIRTESGRMVHLEVAKNRQGRCGGEDIEFIGSRFMFRSVAREQDVGGFYESKRDR